MSNNKKYQGYIKLYRSLIYEDIFKNPLTLKLFIYCLYKANTKDKEWKGMTIKRGSFVSSYRKIAKECDMTVRQVLTHISTLNGSHSVTHTSYRNFTVFIVQNYDEYQGSETQSDTQSVHKPTTTKEKRKKKYNTPTNSPQKGGSVGLYENVDNYPEL